MCTAKQIRVMIVDDHPIMREGLRDALQGEADFEIVGLAGDGVEAVMMAQSVVPDVIVMDVIMPHKDGIEACREIMDLLPDTKVLMLTASHRRECGGGRGRRWRYGLPAEVLRGGGSGGRRKRSGGGAGCGYPTMPSGGCSRWSTASVNSARAVPWRR